LLHRTKGQDLGKRERHPLTPEDPEGFTEVEGLSATSRRSSLSHWHLLFKPLPSTFLQPPANQQPQERASRRAAQAIGLKPEGKPSPSITAERDSSPLRPIAASGTLSSLFRVLCTLRSLYIVRYRSRVAIQPWQGHTCQFKLQSQAALLAERCKEDSQEKHTGANPRGCNPR